MGNVLRELIEYNGISTCSYKDISNFKQMNIDYLFCIPTIKPDIEQIVKVGVDSCIVSSQLVVTPVGKSLEGQNITGYKLLITGDISLKIEYVACDATQSVHMAHTKFPFCGYVVLPQTLNPNAMMNTSVIIEDIFSEQMDLRCIYNNITMMLIVDVC